jgi:hypothetical protein
VPKQAQKIIIKDKKDLKGKKSLLEKAETAYLATLKAGTRKKGRFIFFSRRRWIVWLPM